MILKNRRVISIEVIENRTKEYFFDLVKVETYSMITFYNEVISLRTDCLKYILDNN